MRQPNSLQSSTAFLLRLSLCDSFCWNLGGSFGGSLNLDLSRDLNPIEQRLSLMLLSDRGNKLPVQLGFINRLIAEL